MVHRTQPPEGEVVTEGPPEEIDGRWRQTWTVREHTVDELRTIINERKEALRLQVNEMRVQAFEEGMYYKFPDGTGGHVQLRPEDQINIHSLLAKAQLLEDAEDYETLLKFRTRENETKYLTGSEMRDMAVKALAYGEAIYEVSWTLKDQITQVLYMHDLPTLPDRIAPQ